MLGSESCLYPWGITLINLVLIVGMLMVLINITIMKERKTSFCAFMTIINAQSSSYANFLVVSLFFITIFICFNFS